MRKTPGLGEPVTIEKAPAGSAVRGIPVVLLFLTFIVAGCSIGKLMSNSSVNGSNTERPADPGRAAIAERPLKVDRQMVLNYANLEFTVNKGVISGRSDETLASDDSRPEFADLTFSVVNASSESIRIESGSWKLRLGNGSVYSQAYQDFLQPRDTIERKASFRVPANSQWAGARISLDEENKEPATLNLDVAEIRPQLPVNIATDGRETGTKDPKLAYTVVKATLGLDANGKRAALDKRYLILTVRVTDKGPAGGGGYFLPEFFRLVIDGNPSLPENSSDSALDSGGTQDYSMSYVVPKNLSMADLEVGKTGIQETARIHLDLDKVNP
jgi:hypothetical protein